MKISVKYFAALREAVGVDGEIITTNASTADELFNDLHQRYHFPIAKDHIKIAVNQTYESFDFPLSENDTVVFIPPVAGG